jgi:hypothetical protein
VWSFALQNRGAAANDILRATTSPEKKPLNRKIRYPFVTWAISGAPKDPGVYALWCDDEVIYYGSAHGDGATIHSRLQEHFSDVCTARATHYSWELCRDPARRARELVLEHDTEVKRPPQCNESAA